MKEVTDMEQEIGGWIIVAFAFVAGGWLGYYNHDRINWFLDKIKG